MSEQLFSLKLRNYQELARTKIQLGKCKPRKMGNMFSPVSLSCSKSQCLSKCNFYFEIPNQKKRPEISQGFKDA